MDHPVQSCGPPTKDEEIVSKEIDEPEQHIDVQVTVPATDSVGEVIIKSEISNFYLFLHSIRNIERKNLI